MLVDSYSFIDQDTYREYSGFPIYKNMTSANEEEGYATAFIALFMMDAWNNKSGQSMEMLRNLPSLPLRIKELTSNLVAIHGQHASIKLIDKNNQLHLLDSFGKLQSEVEAVDTAFAKYNHSRNLLQELADEQQKGASEYKTLRYELD